jgi:hypothetical protein
MVLLEGTDTVTLDVNGIHSLAWGPPRLLKVAGGSDFFTV